MIKKEYRKICEEVLTELQKLSSDEIDEIVQYFLFKLNKKNKGDFKDFIKSH